VDFISEDKQNRDMQTSQTDLQYLSWITYYKTDIQYQELESKTV